MYTHTCRSQNIPWQDSCAEAESLLCEAGNKPGALCMLGNHLSHGMAPSLQSHLAGFNSAHVAPMTLLW